MAALDEFVTRARSQNECDHKTHAESLQGLSAGAHQIFTSCSQILDSISQNLLVFGTNNSTELSTLQANLSPLTEKVHQALAQLQHAIESARPKEYSPTGETPQKKDWTYPTTLPQTEDRESMIARLRGLPDPKQQVLRNTIRTPGRSPHKMASPRKIGSPSKMPSPSKAKVYTDMDSDSGNARAHPQTSTSNAGLGGGLKEIDINLVQSSSQRPVSADGLMPSEFSKSVGSSVQQPPLKRNATTGIDGSRLPMKHAANGGKSSRRAAGDGWEKENHTINVLSQSVGAGSGSGRRLRSSTQQ